MDDDWVSEQMEAWREACDHGVARRVVRAIELCVAYSVSELGEHGTVIIADGMLSDTQDLLRVMQAVKEHRPRDQWSPEDNEDLRLALSVLDSLKTALTDICPSEALAA